VPDTSSFSIPRTGGARHSGARDPSGPDCLLSIVVPTCDRPRSLEVLLNAIGDDLGCRTDIEILVVDNHPLSTARPAFATATAAALRVLRYVSERRIGLHHARHAGALAARGELIAYLDDDVLIMPGWIEAILRAFRDFPAAACIGGKVLAAWELTPPEWVTRFPSTYLSLLNLGDQRRRLVFPEGVFGCNMVVRRDVLFGVGGFNPDSFSDRRLLWLRGDGETGLHEKLSLGGYEVVYEPAATVRHRIPASRLTVSHFKWRAFNQGISDSYSMIRRHPSRSRLLTTTAASAAGLARASAAKVARPARDSVVSLVTEAYWRGRFGHQLRTLVLPTLYRHVTRSSYLDEPSRVPASRGERGIRTDWQRRGDDNVEDTQ